MNKQHETTLDHCLDFESESYDTYICNKDDISYNNEGNDIL
jgi:hypothetical protein